MIVATAGHVDHGKTTLVKALTGIITDRLQEEQRRGLTIDLGFAYTDWDGQRWGFIDVPGHQRFIGNMLAGVAALDAALLVVAADAGPQPQTLEHLAILQALGVQQGVVAITRCDLAEPEQQQQTHAALDELLIDSCFQSGPRVDVSAVTGAGIETLRAALLSLSPPRAAHADAGFRLCIDRAFHVSGAGLIVTGTAHAGSVTAGMELDLLPQQKRVRVRELRALDQPAERGVRGQRLALNISGCDKDDIRRGAWLTSPILAQTSMRFDARLQPTGNHALKHGQEVHVHHGAGHTLGRLSQLSGPLWHVAVREPLALLHGDRFIVRDSSARHTLAGGQVLDPLPPGRARRSARRLAELAALQLQEPVTIVEHLLAQDPLALDLQHWSRQFNRPDSDLLPRQIDIIRDGPLIRAAEAWQALQQRLREILASYHAGNPQLAGMGIHQIRAVLDPKPTTETLSAALTAAIRQGLLVRSATHFHLPDHQPRLQPADEAHWQQVRPHLAAQPLQPPVVHDLARTLEQPPAELTTLLVRAHHAGHVVRVAGNRFLLPDAVAELAAVTKTVAAEAEDGLFDVRTYKDAAGIGRNLAIDLLEYFDRAGLTRRFGNHRRLVANPGMLFGTESHPAKR